MIKVSKKLWLMLRTNMLEQPNFADWLPKCLKDKLLSQKLSLRSHLHRVKNRDDSRLCVYAYFYYMAVGAGLNPD